MTSTPRTPGPQENRTTEVSHELSQGAVGRAADGLQQGGRVSSSGQSQGPNSSSPSRGATTSTAGDAPPTLGSPAPAPVGDARVARAKLPGADEAAIRSSPARPEPARNGSAVQDRPVLSAAEAAAARAVAAGGSTARPASQPAAEAVAKPLVTNSPVGGSMASTPVPAGGRPFAGNRPGTGQGATPAYAAAAPTSPPAAGSQYAGPVDRGPGGQPFRPGPAPRPGPPGGSGQPRSARLALASIDPWSVLKLSFLLSVGAGIALVVACITLWSVLNGMGIFDSINGVLGEIGGNGTSAFNIYNYVGLGRVISISTVIAVVNVGLITALSTLWAFLYNLAAGLVGGLHVTLSDD